MVSLNVNNKNNVFIAEENFDPSSPAKCRGDINKAKFILDNQLDLRKKDEISNLVRGLYNSAIESNDKDEEFINNATKVIIDWGQELETYLPANIWKVVRGYKMTSKLLEWQRQLLELLRNEKEVKKAYIFNDGIMDKFWITLTDASTDNVLKYSEIYMDFLADNIDLVCDFMVFSENEVDNYNFPEKTIILNCEV